MAHRLRRRISDVNYLSIMVFVNYCVCSCVCTHLPLGEGVFCWNRWKLYKTGSRWVLIKALLMIKGWLSFWSSCFPNFIYSWYVLYKRASSPHFIVFVKPEEMRVHVRACCHGWGMALAALAVCFLLCTGENAPCAFSSPSSSPSAFPHRSRHLSDRSAFSSGAKGEGGQLLRVVGFCVSAHQGELRESESSWLLLLC